MRKVVKLGPVGLLAFMVGCDMLGSSHSGSHSVPSSASKTSFAPQDAEIHTVHNRFAAFADHVQGFGGVYLDAEQNPHIQMKDPNDVDGARWILQQLRMVNFEERTYMSSLAWRDLGELENRLHLEQARYDYHELADYHRRLREHAVEGLVGMDISSEANAVVVHVEDEVHLEGVSSLVTQLSIPVDAVSVTSGARFEPQTTLDHKIRPVAGGLRIEAYQVGQSTFGFGAHRGSEHGFVTCSHCTGQMGVNNYVAFGQSVSTHQIGLEEEDAPFVLGAPGCAAGKKCRFSDAAYVRYIGFDQYAAGRIVKTTGLFSITLSSLDPAQWYKIIGTVITPLEGDLVRKVGQNSGLTTGYVNNPCYGPVDYNSTEQTLCQVTASYYSVDGDSGSPVFKIVTGNDVVLYGVHAGAVGGTAVFSNIYHVVNEVTASITY